MDYFALILVALSLSMDAFAVSICNGIAIRNANAKQAAAFGFVFGGFQALMPLCGFFLGIRLVSYIESFDHWVAFGLLAFIGGKMFLETFRAEKEDEALPDGETLTMGKLFALGVATSVDALAVGVSMAVEDWNIWISASVIGVVTFALSFAGVLAGKRLGSRFRKNAERLGGLVLIGIGLKILLEHFALL